jgi:hypothetical protein
VADVEGGTLGSGCLDLRVDRVVEEDTPGIGAVAVAVV